MTDRTTTAGAVEQLELARRIAASCPGPVLSPRCHSAMLRGECDDWHGVQAALAAIIETTEAAAKFIERGTFLPSHASERHPIRAAMALRNNDHLKGQP